MSMIPKVIGYVMIFLGVLWAIWPQLLRGWLVGRASWMVFWAIFFSLLYPYASWSKMWGTNEWVVFCIVLAVFGSLLRQFIGKAAEKVPLLVYRIGGALSIASGLYLAFLKK